MATGKAVGRPPKYKSKEEIEEKIDAYFKECEGEILKDEKGKTVFNKFGNPVIINQKPPTVTGLALALGFTTRLSLYSTSWYAITRVWLDVDNETLSITMRQIMGASENTNFTFRAAILYEPV